MSMRHVSVAFRVRLPLLLILALVLVFTGPRWAEAKYASLVVDADTGKILHAINADTRNHPASLTKMMTLYKIFEALESGRWTLDTRLKMSARAARQPPSKVWLKPGQTYRVRDAIPLLIVKSANDIAASVAENHSKTERAFGREMTKTARQLGMTRTVFRNASGLYHSRQLSTARDMARLARALYRDFPQYYHHFARTSYRFNGKTYSSHNKLLKRYQGTDGLKTGYIRAAGFNLVTSVNRDGQRIIGVVFGGRSTKSRDRHMENLLNKGFVRMAALNPNRSTQNRAVASRPQVNEEAAGPLDKWGIQVGAFANPASAKKAATKARNKLPTLLTDSLVKIVPLTKKNGKRLFRARLYNLSKREAYRACAALERRNLPCMELKAKTLELAELSSG